MPTTIDPERLRQVRKARGLTRPALASKARLDKQTIYRIERGNEPKPIRPANLQKLAKALEIDPDVLTSAKPIPTDLARSRPVADDTPYQLNVRVQPAVRNAYELAARRYGASVQKIAQLAPLLFAIVAEASLARRQSKVDECRAKIEELNETAGDLPYCDFLPTENDIVGWEEASILDKDIFGRTLPNSTDRTNPFAAYLDALAERYAPDDVTVTAVGPTSSDYRVCRHAAKALGNGEDALVEALLDGEIPLHLMPRRLTDEQRLSWLREHKSSVAESNQANPEDMPEQLPRYLDLSQVVDIDL